MSEATPARSSRKCKVDGCKRPYRAKGYCVTHYKEWRHGERPKPRYKQCHKEDCRKPMVRGGLCQEHFDLAVKARRSGGEAKPAGETPAAS